MIYFIIMFLLDFEEVGYKLMKFNISLGVEVELCMMFVECVL